MNSVLEIGDNIAFLHKGEKCWEGNKQEILHTDNQQLNDFVYATKFLKNFRDKLAR
jgi:phospholipid/cholesterol/gamma-HCH transport system ATP-binding protein